MGKKTKTKKIYTMKFALLVTLPLISAITIEKSFKQKANKTFNQLDTSDDGFIQPKELVAGLQQFAKARGHEITDEDRAWVEKAAEKADKNGDMKFNKKDFIRFARAFVKHYDIKLAQEDGTEVEISDKFLDEAFDHIDHNDNGTIGRKEWIKAIVNLAQKMNHKITRGEKKWVKNHWRGAVKAAKS